MCIKFSLLIATRNRSELLAECLDDLTRQNYDNFEVIIVDDESTDNTLEVVQSFTNKLDIKYKRNSARLNAAPSFVEAAKLSSGDYLHTVGDDDKFYYNTLKTVAKVIKNYDLLYCNFDIINEVGHTTGKWRFNNYDDNNKLLRELLYRGQNVIPEAIFVKREKFLKLYDEMYSKRLISPFYLPELKNLKFCYLDETLYKYRIHEKSTFSDIDGLIIRNKGVINFINLIMFSYPITQYINNSGIYNSFIDFLTIMGNHANRFFEGTFYTGIKYVKEDMLWGIFYKTALDWINVANRMGNEEIKCSKFKMLSDYNHVEVNKLPECYKWLPWFSYMPTTSITDFVAFDMVTVGNCFLDKEEYTVYKKDNMNIKITNKIIRTLEEFINHISYNPCQIINLNGYLVNDILNYLDKQALYMKYIIILDESVCADDIVCNKFPNIIFDKNFHNQWLNQ